MWTLSRSKLSLTLAKKRLYAEFDGALIKNQKESFARNRNL